jgi:hypothetical protein
MLLSTVIPIDCHGRKYQTTGIHHVKEKANLHGADMVATLPLGQNLGSGETHFLAHIVHLYILVYA